MQKLVRIATQNGSLSPVCEAPVLVPVRAGPSTFVSAVNTEKPGEDRKAFDARQLVLHQAAQDVVLLHALAHRRFIHSSLAPTAHDVSLNISCCPYRLRLRKVQAASVPFPRS